MIDAAIDAEIAHLDGLLAERRQASNHQGYEVQILRGWVSCSRIYTTQEEADAVMAAIARHKPQGTELRTVEKLKEKPCTKSE